MSTDAIVLLKNDHKTVEKLFKQFEKAGEDAYDEKRKIADSIIEELTVHAYIEEEIFYPAARQAVPETKDHVLESVEEHHVVVWMPRRSPSTRRSRCSPRTSATTSKKKRTSGSPRSVRRWAASSCRSWGSG